jgi:hypothetical protein
MKVNVLRAMNNFSRISGWNTMLSTQEVDYWLENYSDLIFCNGVGRRVVFEKITDNNYKVYTRAL